MPPPAVRPLSDHSLSLAPARCAPPRVRPLPSLPSSAALPSRLLCARSMADLAIFDIVDLHLRILKAEVEAAYPALAAHHARVAALPGIAAYLASPRRSAKVNGNNLG